MFDREGNVVASEHRPHPGSRRPRRGRRGLGRTLLAKRRGTPVVGAASVHTGPRRPRGQRRGVQREHRVAGPRAQSVTGRPVATAVRIANDVAAGGVAEHRLGAGVRNAGPRVRLHRHRDRRLHRLRRAPGDRAPRRAAEVGHLAVRSGFPCGVRQEQDASRRSPPPPRRPSLHRAAGRTPRHRAPTRSPPDGGHTTACARQVWQEAVEALADALGMVSLLVGPALVVISGRTQSGR